MYYRVARWGITFMCLLVAAVAFQDSAAVVAVQEQPEIQEAGTLSTHPADLDSNWRIVLSEAISYLAGWQQGSNPIAYAIRAAYLWQNGEEYHYDAGQEPPVCWVLGPMPGEADCNDGIDNDLDTFVDCDDWDCDSSPYCNPESICNDGLDNDGDTFVDCDDWDCDSSPYCNPEAICDDGLDNDGDSFVDCDDYDCDDSPSCNSEYSCNDGLDNDCDTYIDCDDWDCDSSPYCNPEAICNDGLDNDGDSFVDCDDFDCFRSPYCHKK